MRLCKVSKIHHAYVMSSQLFFSGDVCLSPTLLGGVDMWDDYVMINQSEALQTTNHHYDYDISRKYFYMILTVTVSHH